MSSEKVVLSALEGMPEVKSGDCVAGLITQSLKQSGESPQNGNVFVIAQKIVSKSEGRAVNLREVTPSAAAEELAHEVDKDPRLVEIILREARRVVRKGIVRGGNREPGKGRLITETASGMVMANSGVDLSNTGGEDVVTLLPVDSDASADSISSKLRETIGVRSAVIISDTAGRPWREGLVDIAIGCSGIKALEDYRGKSDMRGATLVATEMAVADQIAAAAGILMKKDSGLPVVIVRGLEFNPEGSGAGELLRKPSEDLFR
ncbi:coenzyme F420-0:L-glutamate ligase [Candidatus Mycalebacterium sp.]